MDSEQLKTLVKQRGIVKASMTRIDTYVNNLNDHADINSLKVRHGRLVELWNQYTEIQNTLEMHDESVDHSQYAMQIEELYFDLSAKITSIIDPPRESRTETQVDNASKPSNTQVRLPAIEIPSFSGDYLQWRHFKDTFECIIVNNSSLSAIQRFQYLLSALHGEARQLVQNISISEANFKIAYDLICNRYDNKKLLASQHVKALLSLPTAHKDTVSELRQLVNQYSSNKDALIALQLPISSEELLHSQLILDQLSASTRTEFETMHSNQEFTTTAQLRKFIEAKCQTLELVNFNSQQSSHSYSNNTNRAIKGKPIQPRQSYVSLNNACVICNGTHRIYNCPTFLDADVQSRYNQVQNHQLCNNCLRTNHTWNQCKSNTACFKCNKYHHTLLHKDTTVNNEARSPDTCKSELSSIEQTSSSTTHDTTASKNFCSLQTKPQAQVLLSTAIIRVRDNNGILQPCRAMLDNGSQSNFITTDCVQRLRLNKIKQVIPLQGFNNLTSETTHSVNLEIHSTVNAFAVTINCSILPKITNYLPARYIPVDEWNLPQDIQLADPEFNQPQRVDILLGAQLFMNILRMERCTRQGPYPIVQNTELGWIIGGEYNAVSPSDENTPLQTLFLRSDTNLDAQVQRFWELEEMTQKIKSKEEVECELHFTTNTSRDTTGRFMVKLPFTQDPATMGDSRRTALARLNLLERRLTKNPSLKQDYNDFLTEYEDMGHMKQVDPTDDKTTNCYYLPHHPVFKQSSTTTKMRVVFDASCKTSKGTSLNDILRVGPTIQQDLFSIMLRFRTHKVAFIADINKMYRQVNIHPQDYNYQRILWRKNPQHPIKEYQLTTVTYGTAPAPYLATRCLQQLAFDTANKYPMASEVIQRDFYMDDCISGTDNVEDAIKLQEELREILNSGGFQLRKWSTNNATLHQAIPQSLRETQHSLEISTSEIVKTLGILWSPTSDQFQIVSGASHTATTNSKQQCTKRIALSTTASIFDPLGLISPVVINFKIFLQRLWQENLKWDEPLSTQLQHTWEEIHDQLYRVNEIKIDRLVIANEGTPIDIQLHGFSDASERAFGACLYIRTVNAQGVVTVKLLVSKSKVAPIKQVTLPRLELCAAFLLSQLIKKITRIINLKFTTTYCWTDSTLVLSWIAGCPSRWKTFVANRVSEIQTNTTVTDWHHVPSEDNPADLISRGTSPQNLANNMLWWHGPSWLTLDSSTWPQAHQTHMNQDLSEQRRVVVIATTRSTYDIIERFSKLHKLQRVVAYCLRFIVNSKKQSKRLTGALSTKELHAALYTCIRMAQAEEFKKEINALSASSALPATSKLRNLHPFLDKENTLRVGGRLQQSQLPMETKHQAILPSSHHLTKLIITSEHQRLLHAGPQLLITSLRQQVWVPRIRQVVKATIHQCLRCFKLKAETTQQLMGNLPSYRVQPTRPFINVGVDYAGPLLIKTGSKRSNTKTRAYVAVFICLATRAIHLELVSDLTSSAFIAALRRFMARRGVSTNIFSDNGTNFVGANNELHELHTLFNQELKGKCIADHLSLEGCQWHFIPPSSPHFGGLWEAAVKSMKHHLRRTAGTTSLTFEELTTLLTQIEACLNSRPLTPIHDDHTEFSYLTPGHFLIGEPITSVPSPDLSDLAIHRLSRWQRIQQMMQHIWKRWSSEYLHSLQQRSKWTTQHNNVTPGTLVLVKDDNIPPLQWKVAIVEDIHPGADGLVRVVTLRTPSGRYKRPITKLCPLPTEESF